MSFVSDDASIWLPIAPVVTALSFAGLTLMFGRRDKVLPWLAVIGVAIYVIAACLLFFYVSDVGRLGVSMSNWPAPYGISFSVDRLSAMFVLATAPILAGGMWWGFGPVHGSKTYFFVASMFALIAGVSGAFLTGDIFNLYVWFEVLLISTFGLMSLAGNKKRFEGLLKYALLNLLATTFFLISVGLVYANFGTLNFADLARLQGASDNNIIAVRAACVIMMLAFVMKAGGFPLLFWLPASYHVPLPVVSAVCAAMLSKVGAYALIRTSFLLDSYSLDLLAVIAVITLVFAGIGAVSQSSPRRMAGYMVIMSTGSVIFGLAIGGKTGLGGAVSYALQSMFVLFALYLIAGVSERFAPLATDKAVPDADTASRVRLSIFDYIPVVAIVFLLAGFAMAGLPPFSSFLPKVLMLQEAIMQQRWVMVTALLAASFLALVAVGRIWTMTFLRRGIVKQDYASDGNGACSGDSDDRVAIHPTLRKREIAIVIGCSVIVLALGVFPDTWLPSATLAARDAADVGGYINQFLVKP